MDRAPQDGGAGPVTPGAGLARLRTPLSQDPAPHPTGGKPPKRSRAVVFSLLKTVAYNSTFSAKQWHQVR